ncbi:s1 RNA binding domain-containing protein [Phthorimaea operculella]|nr:s1 RNA binding domain-containing protein [Phthorimaea operculella]
MADTEEYFPRGGKKPIVENFKQNTNFLGAPEKSEKKKKKPKKKSEDDDGYLSDEASKGLEESYKNCAIGLSYKTAKPGVLILGRVRQIHDTKINIMLPSKMQGTVMACHISDAYNKLLEAYVNDQTDHVKELSTMFRPGQYVAVKVLEVDGDHLMLSMMPKDVNGGKAVADLRGGCILQAAVSSVEDHGYVMDIGIPNTRAFLAKKHANPEIELDTGCLTWVSVKSSDGSVIALSSHLDSLQKAVLRTKHFVWEVYFFSLNHYNPDILITEYSDGSVIALSSHLDSLQKAVLRTSGATLTPGTHVQFHVDTVSLCVCVFVISSDGSVIALSSHLDSLQKAVLRTGGATLTPGTHVQFHVDTPLENGIEGHIFKDTTAYVQRQHVDNVKGKKPALGQKVLARVLYVMPTRNTPFLTLRNIFETTYPNLEEEQKFKEGDIIDDAQVLKITGRSIHFKLGKRSVGTMSLKRIQVDEDLTDEEVVSKSYPVGSTHRVRILCYNLSDYIYSVSDQPNILNEKYFSLSQLKIGEIVNATVHAVTDDSVTLTVGRMTGYVPHSHLSDAGIYINPKKASTSKLPKKKYKVGQLVKARVLSVDADKQTLFLTLKPSLLAPELEVLGSYQQAEIGKAYTGVIRHIRQEYILVAFFNNVNALVPRNYVTKDPDAILTEAFHIGQIVNCTILKVDVEGKKMTGSLTTEPFWPAKKREITQKRKQPQDDEIPNKKKRTDSESSETSKKKKKDKNALIKEEDDAENIISTESNKKKKDKKNKKDEQADESTENKKSKKEKKSSVSEPEEVIQNDSENKKKKNKKSKQISDEKDEADVKVDSKTKESKKLQKDDDAKANKKKHKKLSVTEDDSDNDQSDDEKEVKSTTKKEKKKKSKISKESEDSGNAESDDEDIKVVENLAPALEVPSAKDFWTGNVDLQKSIQEEESSSSDDEQEEQPKKKRKKLTVAEKVAKVREEEERVREMERRAIESESQPRSSEQFERALLANPDCSQLWIAYMAFHLQATEIEKARNVGRKALNTINFREEQERLNVWLALLNCEHRFGSKESQQKTLEEALQTNDTFKVHSKLLDILVDTAKHQELSALVDLMLRKYKRDPQNYIICGGACFKLNMVDKARQVMQKAISVLEKKEHVNVLVQFALMERAHGATERAESLFEQILAVYPQRTDVCKVYVDMLAKSVDADRVRQVMERMTSQKLPARKMKVLFKKWIEVEEKLGDEAEVEKIRQRALEFIDKAKF